MIQIIERGSIIFFTLTQAMFERGLDNQNPTTMKPKIVAVIPTMFYRFVTNNPK